MLFLFLPHLMLAQEASVPEPPEEDATVATEKEYAFNPLQATKEIDVGKQYLKRGATRGAILRFREALKWDPNATEAYLLLGQAHVKMGAESEAREAYSKYLELSPDGKQADDIRKKLKQKSLSRNTSRQPDLPLVANRPD